MEKVKKICKMVTRDALKVTRLWNKRVGRKLIEEKIVYGHRVQKKINKNKARTSRAADR